MIKVLTTIKNIFYTKTPIYVIFFVTSVCNAKCKMCFNWKETDKAKKSEELSLDEIKRIFGSFSGIQQLTISGGEPSLRDDLPELLEYISYNNDVQMITLPTNGILSDKIFKQTKNILSRIKETTHLRIPLSVEGIGETHDEITQVPGAFKKLQNTYFKLRELAISHKNFNIDICICCSSFNKKNFKEIIKYCNDFFEGCNIDILFARGDTRDRLSKDVTMDEYRDIVNYLYQLRNTKKLNRPFARILNPIVKIINKQVAQIIETKKMPSRCYAYSKMIVLQSNGDVFPCEHLSKNLGNLRTFNYNIKEILQENANKIVGKSIKDKKCCCTWECALINNIICNPVTYPKILKGILQNIF